VLSLMEPLFVVCAAGMQYMSCEKWTTKNKPKISSFFCLNVSIQRHDKTFIWNMRFE